MEIVNSSKVLQAETRMLLDGKLLVQEFIPLLSVVLCVPLVCVLMVICQQHPSLSLLVASVTQTSDSFIKWFP